MLLNILLALFACLDLSYAVENDVPVIPFAEIVAVGAAAQRAHFPSALVVSIVDSTTLGGEGNPTNESAPSPSNPPDTNTTYTGREVEFSITIVVNGGHVPPGWLDAFDSWMNVRCTAGIGALERGNKEQHLHIQAAARLRVQGPVGKPTINLLRNQIKSALGVRRNDGSGCKVEIKAFAPGQQWSLMLGYITKDEGKPHYRMVSLNVTREEIEAGKTRLASAKLSYEDDRIVLTKKNVFQAAWTFIQ